MLYSLKSTRGPVIQLNKSDRNYFKLERIIQVNKQLGCNSQKLQKSKQECISYR
jgi:hypothetical protein